MRTKFHKEIVTDSTEKIADLIKEAMEMTSTASVFLQKKRDGFLYVSVGDLTEEA